MISVLYLLVRCLLGCLTVLSRGQAPKDAELPVLRHENAVLRRRADRVRYELGLADRTRTPSGLVSASQIGPEVVLQVSGEIILLIVGDVQDRLHVAGTVPLRAVPHAAWMGIRAPALRNHESVDSGFDPRIVRGQIMHRHFKRQPRVARFGYQIGVASQDPPRDQL
jgi:hypothetical protein